MSFSSVKASLPEDLRNYCPQVPWRLSQATFDKVAASPSSLDYKKFEIQSSDPEFAFVMKYFNHDRPTNREIRKIFVVHSPEQTNLFENAIPLMQREANKEVFKPKWQEKESNRSEREHAMRRFEKSASQFSSFTIAFSDQRKEEFNQVYVLPYWHGSSEEKVQSICDTGFTYFGKHSYFGSNAMNKSTDPGYFGSGIYFTNSARYAADIYSDGKHLILAFVSMRKPFPVVSDKPAPEICSDMKKLQGHGAYENYNGHYVPVVSIDPGNKKCAIYYPCYNKQEAACDEVVVFQKQQTLVRFWVEMGIELPKELSAPQANYAHLLNLILSLLEEPAIQSNKDLSTILGTKAEILVVISSDQQLKPEDVTFFGWAKQLLDEGKKVRSFVANKLISSQSSPYSEPAPVQASSITNSNALQETKVQDEIERPLTDSINETQIPRENLTNTPATANLKDKIRDPNVELEALKTVPLQEFKWAIAQEPNNAIIYVNYARALWIQKGSSSQRDVIEEKELYLKALSLDPKIARAYRNLALTLSDKETIKLLDGQVMTKLQLKLKAHSLSAPIINYTKEGEDLKPTSRMYNWKEKPALHSFSIAQNNAFSFLKELFDLKDDSFAFLSGTDKDAVIQIWNRQGKCEEEIKPKEYVSKVIGLGEGNLLIETYNGNLYWNKKRKFLSLLEGRGKPLILKNDLVACKEFEKEVNLVSLRTDLLHHILGSKEKIINECTALHDGTIATGSEDMSVKLWNPETGECISTFKHDLFSLMADFQCCHSIKELKNHTLATSFVKEKSGSFGPSTRSVKLWDRKTGECIRTFEDARDIFELKNNIVATSEDSTGDNDIIKLWDLKKKKYLGLVVGECIAPLKGFKGRLFEIEEMDNGNIVTVSTQYKNEIGFDGLPRSRPLFETITVWDKNGKSLKEIRYEAWESRKKYAIVHNHLIATFNDKVLYIYDQNGQLVHKLEGHKRPIEQLMKLQDGSLLTVDGGGFVQIWTFFDPIEK